MPPFEEKRQPTICDTGNQIENRMMSALNDFKTEMRDIKKEIKFITNEALNRIPVWLTIMMTLGGGIIGILATALFKGWTST